MTEGEEKQGNVLASPSAKNQRQNINDCFHDQCDRDKGPENSRGFKGIGQNEDAKKKGTHGANHSNKQLWLGYAVECVIQLQ